MINLHSILLVLSGLFFASGIGIGGHGFGNGGDPLALSFVGKGLEIHDFLEDSQATDIPFSIDLLGHVIENTSIKLVDTDLYDNFGTKVSAKFVPSLGGGQPSSIYLNRSEWREQLVNGDKKVTYLFVLHEYLWAMDIDDTNYRVSATINLDNLVGQEGIPRAVNFRAEIKKWTTVFKVPSDLSPTLNCQNIYPDLSHNLRSAQSLIITKINCDKINGFLRFDTEYKANVEHRFTYHLAGPYRNVRECKNDEFDQNDILKIHLHQHPLGTYCYPSGANKWTMILMAVGIK